MATVSRRIRRLMSKTSKSVPAFTPEDLAGLSRLPDETLTAIRARIREVQPDHPLAAPKPEPVKAEAKPAPTAVALPVWDGYSKGTRWTPKASKYNGQTFGPWANQTEAKAAIRNALGVDRCPPGTFTR